MKWIIKLPIDLIESSGILIRLMVGVIFISEGIQKYLFSELRGVGRFISIGIPYPEIMGQIVGLFEIVCGILVLIGLYTRKAAMPLLVIMLVAILTTKIPIALESGFWQMAHDGRTDYSMFMGSLYLLFAGAGTWSVDAVLAKKFGK